MLLFVYGTLKRGKRLHPYFRTLRPKFVCEGYVEDFALYYPGVPMAVRNQGSWLQGELYEVNALAIMALDFVETGYKRILVNVVNTSDITANTRINTAYMYEWPIRPHKFDPRDERDRVPNDCY